MKKGRWPKGTRHWLEDILLDAYDEEEQLWAFRQALENVLVLGGPVDGFVIGEPVQILEVDYDGNMLLGIRARCRRQHGDEYEVAAADVVLRGAGEAARTFAAYRMWLGLGPAPPPPSGSGRGRGRHKAQSDDLDLSRPLELVVLAPKDKSVRCRVLGTHREVTLRTGGVWNLLPGEIATVHATKQWQFSGHPFLSGTVERCRLEVGALELQPLQLRDPFPWDPAEQYWGEEDEGFEDWVTAIVARGLRTEYEMEQVLPGDDPEAWDSGPILHAIELARQGNPQGARLALCDLLVADLRCLDAHAHLGNMAFDHWVEGALRHYEAGVRVGELSLGEGFEGVLPWGRIDNRPFLRCLHGYGLCLWRLGRHEEATAVFERMLWLNPGDNQGARFLLDDVRAGRSWEERREG